MVGTQPIDCSIANWWLKLVTPQTTPDQILALRRYEECCGPTGFELHGDMGGLYICCGDCAADLKTAGTQFSLPVLGE